MGVRRWFHPPGRNRRTDSAASVTFNYDCVVIGGGVRLPPRNLALFEVVINAIRKAAPRAAIAFNTRPDDSADATARWVAAGSRAL